MTDEARLHDDLLEVQFFHDGKWHFHHVAPTLASARNDAAWLIGVGFQAARVHVRTDEEEDAIAKARGEVA